MRQEKQNGKIKGAKEKSIEIAKEMLKEKNTDRNNNKANKINKRRNRKNKIIKIYTK